MQKNKFGRIINFTTIAVHLKVSEESIYAASKAATIITLTQILAKELGPHNITVNAIGPNLIKTEAIKSLPAKKLEEILSMHAIKRFGEFEDVANVINFYIKRESNLVTGQIIYLGGV